MRRLGPSSHAVSHAFPLTPTPCCNFCDIFPDLQQLRALTEGFVRAITTSTQHMPPGMRWFAREMDRALRVSQQHTFALVALAESSLLGPLPTRTRCCRHQGCLLLPSLSIHQPRHCVRHSKADARLDADMSPFSAPETFNVLEDVIEPRHRRALAEVSKLLNQIAAGRLFETSQESGTHPLNPLNSYIQNASARFSAWLEDGKCSGQHARAEGHEG